MKVEDEGTPRRSDARRFAALIVITVATAFAIGHTLRQPAFMTANDISRWCTVWSLLERGTYAIDECPWQTQTQDKVERRTEGRRRESGYQTLLFKQACPDLDPDRGDPLSSAADDGCPAQSRCTPGEG